MSYFRALSASLLSAATMFLLVSASSCGTNAVGVDDCRDIEQARCRAGEPCGIVTDVAACERFYRDHCLHGLVASPRAGASVTECVQVIEAAGRCAKADPTSRLSDCTEEPVTNAHRGLATACDVVAHPERADECAFLTDVPSDGSAGQGAGGQAGNEPSASAGQAGTDAAQAGATVQ